MMAPTTRIPAGTVVNRKKGNSMAFANSRMGNAQVYYGPSDTRKEVRIDMSRDSGLRFDAELNVEGNASEATIQYIKDKCKGTEYETGAACMLLFVKNKCKGRILTDSGRVAMDVKTWKDGNCLIDISWMTIPCTYAPPAPNWMGCTAGIAFDHWQLKSNVEIKVGSTDWSPFTWELFRYAVNDHMAESKFRVDIN